MRATAAAWVRVIRTVSVAPTPVADERKDSFSGGNCGIFFVCDGNLLIIASRVGRNGTNPTGRGRLGNSPRHIGAHFESNISCSGCGREAGRIRRSTRGWQVHAAALCVRVMRTVSLPASVAASVRTASLECEGGIFSVCRW